VRSSCRLTFDGHVSPLFTSAPGLNIVITGFENIITWPPNWKLKEISQLAQYLSVPIRTYSRGMIGRLGFAIATSFDPEILLLDEGSSTRWAVQRLIY
jgi:ABC-type polysaccharide/polyol phosphate transport system ATPase subunit